MSNINKNFSLNLFFIKKINVIIKKEAELFFDCKFLENCIRKQYNGIKAYKEYTLNNIWFGEQLRGTTKVFDFWLNKKSVSIGEFWLENFETDWSYMWLVKKYHITITMAQYVVRCISCILAGYQCCIDPTEVISCWRKVWSSDFNIYLSRRYKYIDTNELWSEDTAAKRFCHQFPDTKYNQNIILYVEYGAVTDLTSEIYGLKLKSTDFLLSQMVLSYLNPLVYQKIKIARKYVAGKGYSQITLTVDEFKDLIFLVYALIDDYNFTIKL